jgi:hypothetical protein
MRRQKQIARLVLVSKLGMKRHRENLIGSRPYLTSRNDFDRGDECIHFGRANPAIGEQAPVEAHTERQNEVATDHPIEGGAQVWLYLHRVKPGYARKFLWHGPFRVAEIDTYAARLETDGTTYQLYPLVHISKLKAVRVFPTRPETRLTVPVDGRFDFDEELLPEDRWEPGDLREDVFEVEKIVNMREGRAIRYGRTRREFEVKWRGYPDTTWVDELDLNCGGLLYDFLRERTSRNRFQVMQSHENGEVAGTRPDD